MKQVTFDCASVPSLHPGILRQETLQALLQENGPVLVKGQRPPRRGDFTMLRLLGTSRCTWELSVLCSPLSGPGYKSTASSTCTECVCHEGMAEPTWLLHPTWWLVTAGVAVVSICPLGLLGRTPLHVYAIGGSPFTC